MHGIEEVLNKLRERASLAEQSVGSEEKTNHNYQCEKCKDQLGYLNVKDGIEVWTRCNCIALKRVEKLMKSSEITSEFRKMSFGSFLTGGKHPLIVAMYVCAMDYYKDFDHVQKNRQNSVALLGQPGSGKTHLLTAIANNLIQKKHLGVLYFPYVEGFNDLRDDFEALEEKLGKMKKVDVLFIDDLFKKGSTEWEIKQMYAVINHRYLNHKPIMISSELDVDGLCEVDEALGTRICEMCKDYTVVVKGDRKVLNHRLEGLV
ncbi:ATP-binding protein [Anaerobacillus sp. MEB173]|uniref:ATP-binding protein n=1 Tax=Anaerobacillus sp. MEB173 TaxID=3383345 RepID=UPI003F8DF2A6